MILFLIGPRFSVWCMQWTILEPELFAKTGKMDGGQLYETLKSKGILVRHFNNLKISQYNRITIGTREQMEALINTLKEVLL